MNAVEQLPVATGPGLRDRVADFSSRHRSISVLVGMTIVAVLLPSPLRGPVALCALTAGGLLPAAWSYVPWRRYQREGAT